MFVFEGYVAGWSMEMRYVWVFRPGLYYYGDRTEARFVM